jgi:hypothetical protein
MSEFTVLPDLKMVKKTKKSFPITKIAEKLVLPASGTKGYGTGAVGVSFYYFHPSFLTCFFSGEQCLSGSC